MRLVVCVTRTHPRGDSSGGNVRRDGTTLIYALLPGDNLSSDAQHWLKPFSLRRAYLPAFSVLRPKKRWARPNLLSNVSICSIGEPEIDSSTRHGYLPRVSVSPILCSRLATSPVLHWERLRCAAPARLAVPGESLDRSTFLRHCIAGPRLSAAPGTSRFVQIGWHCGLERPEG